MINRRKPPGAPPTLWARPADVTLNPDFAGMLRPPTAEEKAHMEATLLRGGCPETLYVWALGQAKILLTGYRWYPLLKRWKTPFPVVLKEFSAPQEAYQFVVRTLMAEHTLGRLEVSYLRGLRYLAEKLPHGGDRRSVAARAAGGGLTGEALAEAMGVGLRTLQADGEFAHAVNVIVAHCGEAAKGLLLAPGGSLGRKAILRLAGKEAGYQRRMMTAWEINGKPPKELRRTGRKATLTLPRGRQGFAEVLVRRVGREAAVAYAKAIFRAAARPTRTEGQGSAKVGRTRSDGKG
jgi:hypothetical protein